MHVTGPQRVYTKDDLVTVSAPPSEKLDALLAYLDARMSQLHTDPDEEWASPFTDRLKRELYEVWNR